MGACTRQQSEREREKRDSTIYIIVREFGGNERSVGWLLLSGAKPAAGQKSVLVLAKE